MDTKIIKGKFFSANTFDDLKHQIYEWEKQHPDCIIIDGRGGGSKDEHYMFIVYGQQQEV